jgi:hypothetical protein
MRSRRDLPRLLLAAAFAAVPTFAGGAAPKTNVLFLAVGFFKLHLPFNAPKGYRRRPGNQGPPAEIL